MRVYIWLTDGVISGTRTATATGNWKGFRELFIHTALYCFLSIPPPINTRFLQMSLTIFSPPLPSLLLFLSPGQRFQLKLLFFSPRAKSLLFTSRALSLRARERCVEKPRQQQRARTKPPLYSYCVSLKYSLNFSRFFFYFRFDFFLCI